MTLQDKHRRLAEFMESEIYKDFIKLGREYYDGAFTEAMNLSLEPTKRVSKLDFMSGVGVSLGIFNALKEQYEIEINQGEKDE